MHRIVGNPVGVPNPQSDWNQTDETKADFIKNKPDITNDFTDEYKERIEITESLATENQESIIAINRQILDLDQRAAQHEGDITTLYDEVYYDRERIDVLENNMGNISAALDEIIAIQNSLIGGETA